VAASLPKVHIPVTVTTDGVDKGLSQVEEKMRRSAAKMKRLGQATAGGPAKAAGFAPMAPKATAFLGGVGKLGPLSGLLGGLGAGGLAAAAPLAVFGMAASQVQQLAAMTKGATEALAKFRETGEQTFAVNSAVLERLAAAEAGAQAAAKMGAMDAFTFAGTRPGEKSNWEALNDYATEQMAFIGAMAAGKRREEAALLSELVTASEPRAREINQQLKSVEARRFEGTLSEGFARGEGGMWALEKMAISMMQWWDG